MSSHTRICACLIGFSWFATAGSVVAQSYPAKPVRILVGSSAGGGVDIIARLLATDFSQAAGQQFIVENRSSSIATAAALAKSPADGYSLMLTTASYIVNRALRRDLPYDPLRDIVAISLVGSTPIIIVTHPSLPVSNVRSLVALAKQKPGALNFGSGGIGSPLHLAGELFKQATHVDIVHIAYKGTAPAAVNLASGEVQILFPSVISMYPYIQANRARVLAVMNDRRAGSLPAVATTAEAGYPGLTAGIWYGLIASAGTPRAIVDQLQQLVIQALGKKDIRERLLRDDVEPLGHGPDEFARFAGAELKKWSKVIADAHIKVE
jgi:tripartite-type tricarboxylate transporter receptor subunit TctC